MGRQGGWGAGQGCIQCRGRLTLPPPSQAEGMIGEIRTAFEEALGQLVWMDEKTRQAAKEKVSGG